MVVIVDISVKVSMTGVNLNAGIVFRGERGVLDEMKEDGSYVVWW